MRHDKKTLYLVRHGKSGKNHPLLGDIDRPLHEIGYLESYDIAKKLFEELQIPELIITSSAIRASSTALIFQRVLNIPFDRFKVTDKLYEMDVNDLYEMVADLDDRYQSVMLFGHNPSFSMFASRMDPEVLHIPTAGVIRFDFEVEKWRHSSYINASRSLFLFP